MDPSWAPAPADSQIKFEDSPAESVLSTPDEMYPSLFGTSAATPAPAAPAPAPVNPLEMLPKPLIDDPDDGLAVLAGLTALTQATLAQPLINPTPPPVSKPDENKPVKKRKSWGQVLPVPKTNLPPRKRAKTEDEKEQRRVERVLRNRRAAQSSRERKRMEVEMLERRNKDLEAALRQAHQINLAILEEIQKMRKNGGLKSSGSTTAFDALRKTSLNFSSEIFSALGANPAIPGASSLEQLLKTFPNPTNNTVNPASLSPSLSPIPETSEEHKEPAVAAAATATAATTTPATTAPTTAAATPAPAPSPAPLATTPAPVTATTSVVPAAAATVAAPAKAAVSPDSTQHPAAMLCDDLQCQLAEAPASAWLKLSQQSLAPVLALLLPLQLLLACTSTLLSVCQRPLMQIAMSLKAGFSLPPTRPILNTIIWLVTTPHRSRSLQPTSTSTSTTSSLPTASSNLSPPVASSSSSSPSSTSAAVPSQTRRPSSTLRLRTLRKILTCSPILARPLMDATMEVLRLVSSEGISAGQVSGGDDASAPAAVGGDPQRDMLLKRREAIGWLPGAALPSKEALLTLLWVLKVEMRRLQIRDQITASSKKPGMSGVSQSQLHATTTAPTTMINNTINNGKTPRYVLKVIPKRLREEDGNRVSGVSSSAGAKRRRLQ